MKSWADTKLCADLLCLAGKLEQSPKTENVKPEGAIEKQYIHSNLLGMKPKPNKFFSWSKRQEVVVIVLVVPRSSAAWY